MVVRADSWASSPAARATMLGNKRKDTEPEKRVRNLLHGMGLRYRVDYSPLGGRRRADIVFTRSRIAVFIDGCFWHGCPEHYIAPKSNAGYWSSKIARNTERDAETAAELEEAGWKVFRAWEHEVPDTVANSIAVLVREQNRLRLPRTSD